MKGNFVYFRRPAMAALLLVASCVATAADLRDVVVERNEDRYHLRSETWFNASAEELYRVLTNYDLFVKFTSAFVESRNLEPGADGRPRFYTRMEGCVLLFCKSFERHGHLLLQPMREIVAIVDPNKSDFKYSRESWRLVPEGEGTLLIYNFDMVPSFWVPPVIGPYYIKRTLREGGVDAVDRIEALAQGREPKR
ncbi:MAG: hypothetical protein OEW35_16830 [Gammaproteobacteria bacterium]|nr:hypothetical protein [Gammaproteobacteria bacterium]MDH4255165.1 hypothetical protein [Gammaproteobacteria bacterium]MDH5311536.1 hypothetical protein [Gammaproteobacteria bacterium]